MSNREGLAGQGGTARIAWLDVLRGMAVLMVLWAHLFTVGVNNPATPGDWLPTTQRYVLVREASAGSLHNQAAIALRDLFGINAAGVGVGLLFLVSGFVILRAVDHSDPWNFLLRRALRTLPVCMVAVLATGLLTYLYAARAGVRQPSSVVDVAASSVAMAELLGRFPTIPVLWTLTVELLFYLAIAALALRKGRITLGKLNLLALGCFLFVLLVRSAAVAAVPLPSLYLKLNLLAEVGVYITFMLLGSAIYRGLAAGQGGRGPLHFLAIGLLFLAGYGEYRGPLELHLRVTLADASLSLALFLMVLRVRPSGRWTAPLRWLGGISYSLYLVHVPLGWAVLAALVGKGLTSIDAATLAVAATLLAACLLHAAVERPAHWLARRLTSGGHSAAAPVAMGRDLPAR